MAFEPDINQTDTSNATRMLLNLKWFPYASHVRPSILAKACSRSRGTADRMPAKSYALARLTPGEARYFASNLPATDTLIPAKYEVIIKTCLSKVPGLEHGNDIIHCNR